MIDPWVLPARRPPPDFKWTVLKAVHDFGYVYKKGLAQLFRVHPVFVGRVIDQLVAEKFVRLAGYQVGCPYCAFHYKYFYTPTRADLKSRPEITRFHPRPDYQLMNGPMPVSCFVARRGVGANGCAGANGNARKREEWVPIHFAGAHVAMAFVASVFNQSSDVQEISFSPERVLRRASAPLDPMPDGVIGVNEKAFQYQLEFESTEKYRGEYVALLDRYERAVLPTVYVALTLRIANALDRVTRDRKRIAVVMYGDQEGCIGAFENLNADLFWQPPQRYQSGPKAGFDLGKAQDDDIAAPGAR